VKSFLFFEREKLHNLTKVFEQIQFLDGVDASVDIINIKVLKVLNLETVSKTKSIREDAH
jgi:hypothetical protein